MKGKKILTLALTVFLSTCSVVYADGDLDFSDEVVDDVYEEPIQEPSVSPAPSTGEVEYEYVPPTIKTGGKSESALKWQNMYSGFATYTPTIKVNQSDIYSEGYFNDTEEDSISEKRTVFFTNGNGVKVNLGIDVFNNKIRFGNEKQIYEEIYKELAAEKEEIWWLDAGDKCILSYNGKLLISYAAGEKSYETVEKMFSTFEKGQLFFEKI